MAKPQIFVSCGQRTIEEKQLGEEICQAIRDDGVFDCFFAESQHNLKGLHENIFDALARASGFVAVMHRRGNISYENKETIALIRASVWIEQEIAIAAFIQRTSRSSLLTAAYIENGVGREGLRELLHLNPIEFKSNDQVIEDFKAKLDDWHQIHSPDSAAEDDRGKLELQWDRGYESGLQVIRLRPILANKGARVKEYSCTIEIPDPLLSFNTAIHVLEVQTTRLGYRKFRVTEENKGNVPLLRDSPMLMLTVEVAIGHLKIEQRSEVLRQKIHLTADMEDRFYSLSEPCSAVLAQLQN